MDEQNAEPIEEEQGAKRWDRGTQVRKVLEFKALGGKVSQREFADWEDIPRTTFQRWVWRHDRPSESREVVAFFESPAGLAVLHCICVAAHFVMTLMGPQGVRKVALFLELSGLGEFVGTSVGAQYEANKNILEGVAAFEEEQRPQLIEELRRALKERGMEKLDIILLEDETFHPSICLVAIEAFSNFIMLEGYSDKRDAATWNKRVEEALQDFPVRVVAVCSDEGRGLLAHIDAGLGAQHICELFHAQNEITKGCSASLSSRVRHANASHEKAKQKLVKLEEKVPRNAEAEKKLLKARANAEDELSLAQGHLCKVTDHREKMSEAVRGLAKAYHPFDLESGAKRSPELVCEELESCFQKARDVSEDAGLAERAQKSIEKSARLRDSMVATVAFFHAFVARRVSALDVSAPLKECLTTLLLPMLYLKMAAKRASKADDKHALLDAAQALLERIHNLVLWQALAESDREALLLFAHECASFFVRSDSAVEGRNGQLSLHHHGIHRLSPQKLKALTIVHNYFLRRPDGTTAAQRFFRTSHPDLFKWLLDNTPLPVRPAKKGVQRARTRRAA